MIRQYRKRNGYYIADSDRAWDDIHYADISRPTEDMVIKKLCYNIPYPFDDTIEHKRKTETEFTVTDWRLYLMLMYLKNRVRFGADDKSQTAERNALKQASTHLQIDYYDIILFHAELLTKMRVRGECGMEALPSLPIDISEQHKALVKRIELQTLNDIA